MYFRTVSSVNITAILVRSTKGQKFPSFPTSNFQTEISTVDKSEVVLKLC